ncbi:hypothetical protein BB561_000620 [Smittium simulii]|uniref:T-complex protein 1 subunit eta n=1 Tax=Smittium simulii TaxID=133385 RepID=A0A2T9YY94_9FUNG|nr:hypothetical protein BB561_000620 [Smittium simulii]
MNQFSGARPPMMQPQVIILKEGTDTSQGVGQIVSNINACLAVCDTLKATLGPLGMDKLIVDENNRTTISNDGATIINKLEIIHPAARLLVDIAKAQDAEIGDGTTSVVLMAGGILREIKEMIEDGQNPHVIIRGLRAASQMAVNRVNEVALSVDKENDQQMHDLLIKCARTSMSSKLINTSSEFFADLAVRAILTLDKNNMDQKLIGIKKIPGGGMEDSILVDGVAFKKAFSYAGFEQQPKMFTSPKIICLNIELELKSEKDNAEVRIDKVSEYQNVVDAEWKIIFDKLDDIVKSGAQVVLSMLPIGDVATQYFADRQMFCAGRIPSEDMQRVCLSTGAQVISTTSNLQSNLNVLGSCGLFEERQIGGQRINMLTECPKSKSCTLVLRGGAEQFIDEIERSLHDSLMVVKRMIKNNLFVAGGGSIEMELSRYLKQQSRLIEGKQQLIISAVAKALETIPRQLCDNAGFDTIKLMTKLRASHATDPVKNIWVGIDMNTEQEADMFENFVLEPAAIKINAILSSIEASCLILGVDETISSQQQNAQQQQQMMSRGRGRGRGH